MTDAPMNRWAANFADPHPEQHELLTHPASVVLDLTPFKEVRITAGEHFVATTPEHLIECVAWLLTNVDTDTVITKDGIEVDA